MAISAFLCPFMVKRTRVVHTRNYNNKDPGNPNPFWLPGAILLLWHEFVSKSYFEKSIFEKLIWKRVIHIKFKAIFYTHTVTDSETCGAASFHNWSCHQVGTMTPPWNLGKWGGDADRTGGDPILVNALISMFQSIEFLFVPSISRELDKVVITNDADICALIFSADKHASIMPITLYSRDGSAHGRIHSETGWIKQTRGVSAVFRTVGPQRQKFALLSAEIKICRCDVCFTSNICCQ